MIDCKKFFAAILLPAIFFMAGCASRGGKTYSDGDVRSIQRVQTGTVTDVTEVMVESDSSLVGPILGGVTGGVLGSLLGGGSGKVLFAVGGATAGALAGGAGEAALRRYPANQITVELDSGGYIVVVQGNEDFFVKGDRVRILTTGENKARVQHE